MAHKAIDETQTIVIDREGEETEGGMWDFLNIHSLHTKGKKRLLIVGDSITPLIPPVMLSPTISSLFFPLV